MYLLARVTLRLLLIIVSLIAASTASAGTITIDTTPGTSFQGPFGEPPASPFFGQTITPPLGADLLTSFTFFLERGSNDPVVFQGVVVEWDPSSFQPTGPDLFLSGLQSTAGSAALQTFQFGPLAIPVDPAKQYLLLLSAVSDGVPAIAAAPQRGDNPLPGGQFVISNDGQSWFTGTSASGVYDLAFIADFTTTVPEPSYRFILAIGCLLYLAVQQYGRRRSLSS